MLLPFPVLRLKPKANAKAIRHGAAWVHDTAVVTGRRRRKIAPGRIALLENDTRTPLALIAVNPGSRIFARMPERDPTAEIGPVGRRAGDIDHVARHAEVFTGFDGPDHPLHSHLAESGYLKVLVFRL